MFSTLKSQSANTVGNFKVHVIFPEIRGAAPPIYDISCLVLAHAAVSFPAIIVRKENARGAVEIFVL